MSPMAAAISSILSPCSASSIRSGLHETVGARCGWPGPAPHRGLDAGLRQTYGRRNFDAALSQDRAAMMREIRDQIRPEALALGIEVSMSGSGAPT